jgi:MoxR-like ATPase
VSKEPSSSGPDPSAKQPPAWYVYRNPAHAPETPMPEAPPWRRQNAAPIEYDVPPAERDDTFQPDANDVAMINAAICLRRPLLVTGRPGAGKSSLARSVAYELGLGRVLVWAINSRSTLQEGLYQYDALARLQDASRKAPDGEATSPSIGRYLRLGSMGTALLPRNRPRVLLIDEIDKSDIDLPNDLLHVFERGSFAIPELQRAARDHEKLGVTPADAETEVSLPSGEVQCREFPLVILTSNGERDFPPAFNRRCLRLDMTPPNDARLRLIVEQHFRGISKPPTKDWEKGVADMIKHFLDLRDKKMEIVATDQLLNALHFLRQDVDLLREGPSSVLDAVLRGLVATSGSVVP